MGPRIPDGAGSGIDPQVKHAFEMKSCALANFPPSEVALNADGDLLSIAEVASPDMAAFACLRVGLGTANLPNLSGMEFVYAAFVVM